MPTEVVVYISLFIKGLETIRLSPSVVSNNSNIEQDEKKEHVNPPLAKD